MVKALLRDLGRQGVVTFLDVLGWQGVYNRKPDALSILTGLVRDLTKKSEAFRGLFGSELRVKSISDTIAMFLPCKDDEISNAIEAHGELCRWLVPASIRAEIPMRGATAFGEFELEEQASIFVGKAVDEAAAWHEHSDWVGVHLTPSAEYVFKKQSDPSSWIKYTPPTKTSISWKPHCVNWVRDWESYETQVDDIKTRFRRLGPIVPEIASKFANTLKFIEEVKQDMAQVPAA